MSNDQIENLNIERHRPLLPPCDLKAELPVSDELISLITSSRQEVRDILDKKDHRIMVVVGPCSIHDPAAALDYAKRLKTLSDKVKDNILIIMRVYFEKPRTTVGWKGLINDPYLNDTFKIEDGLKIGRKLLIDIGEIGLPTSTEALDPVTPQYLQDLITWSAIGARTTESQTHREMASGLSSAVGFKNGTDGGLTVAIQAMMSCEKPHRFLGIDDKGRVSIIVTQGNPYSHVVLRGGGGRPNYDSVNVALCEKALLENNLPLNIMVDCSHANSNKDPGLQPLVVENISNQILEGNQSIIGLMIESNLGFGRQNLKPNLDEMEYGISVTDGCIDWEMTEKSLLDMNEKIGDALKARVSSD